MAGFIDESDSGSVVPAGEVYKPAGATAAVLNIPAIAHPDYRLMYNALRWGWFGGEWLPVLRKFVLDPGIDNVGKDGDPTDAFALEAKAGWEVIPVDVSPVTVNGQTHGYIVPYPAVGGKAYLSPWHKIKVLGGQVFLSSNEAGYRDWLRKVMAIKGWKPDPDAIYIQRQKLETELNEELSKPSTNETAKLRAKALRDILDAIDGKTKAARKVGGES